MHALTTRSQHCAELLLRLVDAACAAGSTIPSEARLGAGRNRSWRLVLSDVAGMLEIGEMKILLCEKPFDLYLDCEDGLTVYRSVDKVPNQRTLVFNPLPLGAIHLDWELCFINCPPDDWYLLETL